MSRYGSMAGLSATVRLEKLELCRGVRDETTRVNHNNSRMEFRGTLTDKVFKDLFDAGIDPRAGVGNPFSMSIDFGISSVGMNFPEEVSGHCIGELKVYLDEKDTQSPVSFGLEIRLPATDLPDLISISNHPIEVDPTFLSVNGNKLFATTSGQSIPVLHFYILSVYFFPLIPNPDDADRRKES